MNGRSGGGFRSVGEAALAGLGVVALLGPGSSAMNAAPSSAGPATAHSWNESSSSQNRAHQSRPWTFLIYGAADNNADGPILHFLEQIRREWAGEPGVEIVLFLDRSEGFSDDASILGEDFTDARLYRMQADGYERLDGGEEFPEITIDGEYESDSASPATLRRFLEFGKARFPADRYGLMIYGHADCRAMLPDDQSGREMGFAELTDEVGEDLAVDFLALELCNMGGIEVAYQWRPGNGGFYAEVLLAIPNAGPPLDWHRAFARIRSAGPEDSTATAATDEGSASKPLFDPADLTAEDFGRLVIEEAALGRIAYAEAHPQDAEDVAYESAGAYRLDAAIDVKETFDDLARALHAYEAKEIVLRLRGNSGDDCAMNYVRSQFEADPLVDLYDFCQRIAECDELDESVQDLAWSCCDAVDEFVLASFAMEGIEGFEPDTNGVFVVVPNGEAPSRSRSLPGSSPKNRWYDFRWYTPRKPVNLPNAYGHWAWCSDGATEDNGVVENWFELLDAWFDSEQGGGFNEYRW